MCSTPNIPATLCVHTHCRRFIHIGHGIRYIQPIHIPLLDYSKLLFEKVYLAKVADFLRAPQNEIMSRERVSERVRSSVACGVDHVEFWNISQSA
jgi:hypothetical protein